MTQNLSYRITQALLVSNSLQLDKQALEQLIPDDPSKKSKKRILQIDPFISFMLDIVSCYKHRAYIVVYYGIECKILDRIHQICEDKRVDCDESEKRNFFLRCIKVHKDLITEYYFNRPNQQSILETFLNLSDTIQQYEKTRITINNQDLEFGHRRQYSDRSLTEFQEMKTQVLQFLSKEQPKSKRNISRQIEEEIIIVPIRHPTEVKSTNQQQEHPRIPPPSGSQRPRGLSYFPFPLDGVQQAMKNLGNKLLGMFHMANNDQLVNGIT